MNKSGDLIPPMGPAMAPGPLDVQDRAESLLQAEAVLGRARIAAGVLMPVPGMLMGPGDGLRRAGLHGDRALDFLVEAEAPLVAAPGGRDAGQAQHEHRAQ